VSDVCGDLLAYLGQLDDGWSSPADVSSLVRYLGLLGPVDVGLSKPECKVSGYVICLGGDLGVPRV